MGLYLFAFLTAMFFGWPLITRTASVHPVNLSLWVTIFALPALLVAATTKGVLAPPSGRDLALISAGGVFLGLGMLTFGKLTSTPAWPISTSAPTYTMMVTVVFMVGGVAAYNEQLTLMRGLGVVLALAAIWCLK